MILRIQNILYLLVVTEKGILIAQVCREQFRKNLGNSTGFISGVKSDKFSGVLSRRSGRLLLENLYRYEITKDELKKNGEENFS